MKIYDSEIIDSPSEFVKERMIKYILSKCDRVEFLLEVKTDNPAWSYFSREIKCLFEDNLISVCKGESYGMHGTCYLFKLTDDIRNYFLQRGNIVSRIDSELDKAVYFDNPAFYIGNECVVSNCSHEGIIDINNQYRKEFEGIYLKYVQSDPVYFELRQKFKGCDTSNFDREFLILSALGIYIKDSNSYISVEPYIESTFKEYQELANKYFSKDLAVNFNSATAFVGVFFNNFEEEYFKQIHYLKIISGVDDKVFYI